MKNIEPEINSTLDIAGKKFSEFKDITLENTQIKTQKKRLKKVNTTSESQRTTSSRF